MKYRITYKEITMLIGLLVAAAVVLTLWMRTPQANEGNQTGALTPLSQPAHQFLQIQVTQGLSKIAAEIIH